ncbi:Holliday junction branch migration DNA helicase RuvB [bacterium]|nr:Holliday junction branch migration DNA helicase RuvB [bacterium]
MTSSAPDNILRPKALSEYVGQRSVVSKLEVFLKAAQQRKTSLDHVLLSGPPGLGKTTLAYIIAKEMGGRLHQAPGPSLDKSVDLLALLSNIQEGDVLFVDEIHRLNAAVEESLYPAMEDFQVQMMLGEGSMAQPVNLPLPRFTLIGATTQPGKITGPLRDRFGIPLNLEFYSFEEMHKILERSAKILGVELSSEEIHEVARRSRGTPRIANRLLARVRDFIEVEGAKLGGGVKAVKAALEFLDVDARGLQPLDRRYLSVLMKQFRGGPAGVEALAATMSEDKSTLEETIEPFLLKEELIVRTPRGRVATDLAYEVMGLPAPASDVQRGL